MRLNKSKNRIATNSSELSNNGEFSTDIISLENDEYTYIVARNNMNFDVNADFTDYVT